VAIKNAIRVAAQAVESDVVGTIAQGLSESAAPAETGAVSDSA
jgi:hypothetical protein